MATDNNIGNRIDQLLNKDFENLTTDIILQTIFGERVDIPYEDLQSEEGFNRELEKSSKEVEELIKSLEPQEPPIPISKIEELSCNYDGDSLYAQILLETVKKDDPGLYSQLLKSGALDQKTITQDDLGVKSQIPSLIKEKQITSSGILDFLQKNNPNFLERTNERIFDNLDPLTVGKPSNSGAKKKRELNVLGFKIPLEFIMSGKKIAHVKLSGPKITNQEALDRINETLELQYKNSNPCDFDGLDLISQENDGESDTSNLNNRTGTSSTRIDEYDSNFFPEGDDPILDQDCAPGLPEDPITGDVILTEEAFNEASSDFCDPPAYDFSGLNPDEPDPEPTPVDVDAIQSCIDSALDKANKIDENNKLLGRWSMIEKFLEEVLYHYEIVWEYQRELKERWQNKVTLFQEGSPTNIGAVVQALTYNDEARILNSQILQSEEDFKSVKNIFLENNPIFTKDLFNLSVLQIEEIEAYTDQQTKDLIKDYIDSGASILTFDSEKNSWPIDEGAVKLLENLQEIRTILIKGNFIEILKTQRDEALLLSQANLDLIEERQNKNTTITNLEDVFKSSSSSLIDVYGIGVSNLIRFRDVFKNKISPQGFDSYGYDFVNSLKKFSVRFKEPDVAFSRAELQFEISFMNNFGFPLPYKTTEKPGKISMSGSSSALKDVVEPDVERIKLGNEFGENGGLLSNYPTDIFKNYQFIKINNLNDIQDDVAEFYDFIEKIIDTEDSKSSIIEDIRDKRGILYGDLIEKSGSNWLFFNAEERGDNDARDPSKLRPSSFTGDGEPNPIFSDFYGNFKPKWDSKYQLNKTLYIDPELNRIKDQARRAAEGASGVLPSTTVVGVRIFENYFEMKKRMDQIEEIFLFASQKRQEVENSLTPESLEKEFSDVKCAGASNGQGDGNGEEDPENCPPSCCGEAGSDFKFGGNYLLSSPPSSDCPTIFQRCWWKQFCKDVTKVGLLPYPNGLPPIEKTSFFLSQGPTVRLGLKYWPVGYLPPSFIPIPVPNPIDGQPYIRIPLPMIWTIIPPIVIPLPLNLGVLVIFIPLIGGFMPTPLVYLKEFVTGSSLFLTGIRGPRFIPRKSDPELKDPLEKIKQALSFGIPDKLIPLPGFGKDDIDSPSRIIADIQSNFTKILDNIPPPGNIDLLRDVQQKELDIKTDILDRKKEYEKKAALIDDPAPNFDQDNEQLELIINERKESLKQVIKEYLNKGIPNPKSIYFPREKDRLKTDTTGAVKSLRMLKDLKSKLVPIKSEGDINFKDEIREVLKLLKIPTPPTYSIENFGVSNQNKIFLKSNKDPRIMDEDEFQELVKEIRSISLVITHILLRGNKFSVSRKVRKGVFSIVESSEYQGDIKFPPFSLTNSAPKPLKFLKVPNSEISGMYQRIMDGMSKSIYSRDDFSKYVRYSDEEGLLVIRVKDLKKLISKKLGLAKKGPFELDRPLDLEEPKISKFPKPGGILSSEELIGDSFGNAISAFELPTVFPPKSDQFTQTQGVGGISQITIPGSVIKSFVVNSINKSLDSGLLEALFPEVEDINSPKFINIQPADIQKIVRNMIGENFNPESPNIPDFLNAVKIPVIPPARPTGIVEQALIGMGAPPPARLVYTLFWKYFKGVPKTPLGDIIVRPALDLSASILTKIPWALTVLLGRNLVNLINPVVMSDDHPSWRRMSLKNVYYVVYIDEFLRSAADVSGLFKFFLGSADPTYPLPELKSELDKAFNTKKY